jgi:hypothetical protein
MWRMSYIEHSSKQLVDVTNDSSASFKSSGTASALPRQLRELSAVGGKTDLIGSGANVGRG